MRYSPFSLSQRLMSIKRGFRAFGEHSCISWATWALSLQTSATVLPGSGISRTSSLKRSLQAAMVSGSPRWTASAVAVLEGAARVSVSRVAWAGGAAGMPPDGVGTTAAGPGVVVSCCAVSFGGGIRRGEVLAVLSGLARGAGGGDHQCGGEEGEDGGVRSCESHGGLAGRVFVEPWAWPVEDGWPWGITVGKRGVVPFVRMAIMFGRSKPPVSGLS